MSLPLGTPASPRQQKTVLVIEDDPYFQEQLTAALVGAGYKVQNAYDGQAGVESVLTEAPDLVILDLVLPKKDGFKVLRELKRTKNIPVLVLSNLENTENIELAIRLGAKSYLVKSNFSIGNIVEKIRGVLGDT
jgi:DNA-binding response OmpR family regulator